MLFSIQGKVVYIAKDYIVIENQNIGFRIFCLHTENIILDEDKKLYLYVIKSEEATTLYGFDNLKL